MLLKFYDDKAVEKAKKAQLGKLPTIQATYDRIEELLNSPVLYAKIKPQINALLVMALEIGYQTYAIELCEAEE